MDDLLPCPFCGGVNLKIGPWLRSSQVVCYACGTRGPEVSWPWAWSITDTPTDNDIARYRAPYEEEARRLWNQRTTMHVHFTKSEVVHETTWPFVLLGRPVIESDDLVTPPIIVGGHLLEPGETIAEVLDRIDDKPTP